MPISTDVLNSTLADLYAKGGNIVINTLTRRPLMRKLLDPNKINKSSIGGTYIEMPFGSGSPAKATRILSGSETAVPVRKQITSKYRIQTARQFIPIVIPNKDLRMNDGRQGIAKLIKSYPMATSESFLEDWEYWFLTGAYRSSDISVVDTPGFDGFATLNGNVTATAAFDSNTGWCQALAAASQSGNVQNVARSSSINHVNQYGTITSFASDGMAVINRVQALCATYGACDMGFADSVTYANILANNADVVRIKDTGDSIYDKDAVNALQLGQTRIYNMTVNLDPTNASFSGTTGYSTSETTGGVLYFCSTDFMEVPEREAKSAPKFAPYPGQDYVIGDMAFDNNVMVEKLPAFGIVTGGRIP